MDSYWHPPKDGNASPLVQKDILSAVKAIEEAMRPRLERREKALFVSDQEVFSLLRLNSQYMPHYCIITEFDGIPSDAVVDRVLHAPMERGFWFIITHPTFEPVPDGAPAPRLNLMRRYVPVSVEPQVVTDPE